MSCYGDRVRHSSPVSNSLSRAKRLILEAASIIPEHESDPKPYQGSIGWAVQEMCKGRTVHRRGWNGKGQYLKLQVPDENSKMTQPYVYITTVQGDLIPWLCSQSDLLARDWEYVSPVRMDIAAA